MCPRRPRQLAHRTTRHGDARVVKALEIHVLVELAAFRTPFSAKDGIHVVAPLIEPAFPVDVPHIDLAGIGHAAHGLRVLAIVHGSLPGTHRRTGGGVE